MADKTLMEDSDMSVHSYKPKAKFSFFAPFSNYHLVRKKYNKFRQHFPHVFKTVVTWCVSYTLHLTSRLREGKSIFCYEYEAYIYLYVF